MIPAILLLTAMAAQAANEKTVKSTVKNVTVFTQGAQVFRSAAVSLQPGTTSLVFSGVSPVLNASSIQAGGKGNFIILEVKHNVRYPEPPKNTEGVLPKEIRREIKEMQDSLTELGFNQDDLTERRNALLLEKNMIQKNKLAVGEGKSDSLAVLMQAMEFFRAKLGDINARLIRIKRDEHRILNDRDRITARLANLKTYSNDNEPNKKYEPVQEVVVTVSADEPVTGTVELSYMVSNAGWTPSYDLRSGSTSGPVQLTYKANVFQSTGEEWENVTLKLSTGNPNRSSTKPELPVWYLNYYFPKQTLRGESNEMPAMMLDEVATKDLRKKMEDLGPAQSAANYTQIVETMTNVLFDVKLAYSIPSDGVAHVVPVKTDELPASYVHYLVPKLDREAFLLAQVTGWEQLNLLPGSATIFFEGTYVGQTMLNPMVLDDTLELAMGRDHGITVTRNRLPVTEKNKLLGNEITKTITYELKMKNSKSGKINLVIQDQVPVTQNKDIKVEMKDGGKADYNSSTGMLRWESTLNSRENKSFSFTYAVTYQKGMQLSMF